MGFLDYILERPNYDKLCQEKTWEMYSAANQLVLANLRNAERIDPTSLISSESCANTYRQRIKIGLKVRMQAKLELEDIERRKMMKKLL